MRTLFITDLDGTLLTPEGKISELSLSILNKLLSEGMLLTCATARTASTALPITRDLKLNLPIILMNGSAVYDRGQESYSSDEAIPPAAAEEILSVLAQRRCPAFVYSIEGNKLLCYAPPFLNESMQNFRQYRQRFYGKRFVDIAGYADLAGRRIIYFTFVGKRRELLPVYDILRGKKGFSALFYQDVYTDDWFLELSCADVNKGTAALSLKQKTGAEKLCVFGDNLNDLPLLAAADYSFATANAKPAILEKADCIIGPNTADAVAKTLAEIWQRGSIEQKSAYC